MPQLGESVAEGTIGKWLKQPGDTVEKYEPLLEVITDKVNAEVPSPFAGVLKEILAEEGATVPNNAEIAVIETAEDAAGGGTATDQPTVATVVAPDDKGAPSTAAAEPSAAPP
ncbi:MAG: 2-oxo acid dehydrogenase subunit E2, partial [Chloroflexi bacterium]|nr:2-oxo acid dehydrogenase subunit E2 [Chloroflexota bacterium]